jgi:hypothetical protein
MSLTLVFMRKWKAWYHVLRHGKGFPSWIPCAMAYGWHEAEKTE